MSKYLWLLLLLCIVAALLVSMLPASGQGNGSCEADFSGDRRVSLPDVSLIGGPSYNKSLGQEGYHPRFDITGNNVVNLADISAMNQWYNQDCEGGAYVEAFGDILYTPDDPDYDFIGVNRYNLLTVGSPFRGCGSAWTEAQLVTWFDEVEAQGVDVVRMWAFQEFTEDGTDFDRFDYVLGLAYDRHIRVIPTFENHWSACTQGGNKTQTWYDTGYLSPYGSYTESLKDYVAIFVDRYKDDDRIAMWQVMNEAETSSASILREFADDIATDIQAIDANHLVSFGTLGAGQQGTQGSDYETLHDLASIDVCEYHDYGHITEPIPTGSNLLSTRLTQCDKPIFIGEAGIDLVEESVTEQERADYIDAKIDAFLGAGGAGYLYWSYRDRDGADSLEYDADDPLAGVIGSY